MHPNAFSPFPWFFLSGICTRASRPFLLSHFCPLNPSLTRRILQIHIVVAAAWASFNLVSHLIWEIDVTSDILQPVIWRHMAPDCAVQRSVIRCKSRTIGSTSYRSYDTYSLASQTKFLSYKPALETVGTVTDFRSWRLTRTTFLYAQRWLSTPLSVNDFLLWGVPVSHWVTPPGPFVTSVLFSDPQYSSFHQLLHQENPSFTFHYFLYFFNQKK